MCMCVCLPGDFWVFKAFFMYVYCITHREIKVSCDKGDDIQYITHVIYRSTDISSPCHMTAKSRLKVAVDKLVITCLHCAYKGYTHCRHVIIYACM